MRFTELFQVVPTLFMALEDSKGIILLSRVLIRRQRVLGNII